jgi:plastocyanin
MAFDLASTVTFTNVAPGTHTITVYLANPDHSLVSPAVSKIITINVAAPAAAPTVSVTSPANGATVSDTFTVMVSSANFNVPAQGHYHVYLDGQISAEKMAFSQVSTVTFNNVASGTHTITAYLAKPDHSALQPSVSKTITVNVEQSGGGGMAPTISIVSPSGGSTVQGQSVTVTLSSANMPSQGYYHVSLDGMSYVTGAGPTFTFPSVTSGTHTITARILKPDGTLLSPDVSKTITITVNGGAGGGGGGY